MSGTGAAPMGRNEEDFRERTLNRDASTKPEDEADDTNSTVAISSDGEDPIMWANGAV